MNNAVLNRADFFISQNPPYSRSPYALIINHCIHIVLHNFAVISKYTNPLKKELILFVLFFSVKSFLLAHFGFYTDRKRRVYDAPKMKPNNGQQPFGKKTLRD